MLLHTAVLRYLLTGRLSGRDYDILAGKVANDRTNPTITAYLAGLFGEVGSMRADEQCVSMLMPENLENQICLRTSAALACISFEGAKK